MNMGWITFEGEQILSEMSKENQKKELLNFFVTMMDLNEQTEKENIYIGLHKALEGMK